MASIENKMKSIVSELQKDPTPIHQYVKSLFDNIDLSDNDAVIFVVKTEFDKFWSIFYDLKDHDAFNEEEIQDIYKTAERLNNQIFGNNKSDQEREYGFSELASMVYMFKAAQNLLAA